MTVVGLTADRSNVVLRAGDETFELALADVRQAERPAAPAVPGAGGLVGISPRDVQQRIRRGESAAAIAAGSGAPLAAVQRYEGPVLAEREHQVGRAQRALVDGRVVGDLMREHFARVAPEAPGIDWDCWLTDPGRWEVTASAAGQVVRLRWDTVNRRVQPLDETGRQVLLLAPAAEDALGAVLRPVASRAGASSPSSSSSPPSSRPVVRPRGRAEVPSWTDIATEVAGRELGAVPSHDADR